MRDVTAERLAQVGPWRLCQLTAYSCHLDLLNSTRFHRRLKQDAKVSLRDWLVGTSHDMRCVARPVLAKLARWGPSNWINVPRGRTPLSGILAAAELMGQSDIMEEPDLAFLVHAVHSSCRVLLGSWHRPPRRPHYWEPRLRARLRCASTPEPPLGSRVRAGIVHNLGDIKTLEHGGLKLKSDWFSLSDLLAECVQVRAAHARSTGRPPLRAGPEESALCRRHVTSARAARAGVPARLAGPGIALGARREQHRCASPAGSGARRAPAPIPPGAPYRGAREWRPGRPFSGSCNLL